MSTTSDQKLRGSQALLLAGGVVVLEFASAVTAFVAGTLLPVIEHGLDAGRFLPLLVAGSQIGMFTGLPLSTRIMDRHSPGRVLGAGLVLSVLGSGLSALAPNAAVFATGQFVAGFAGAVLAVYGISAAIRHLEDALRLKVVAAMSAMWILPALVGPTATIALEHLAGWRVTLLAPLPLMVAGRVLVVRSVPAHGPEHGRGERRPLATTMLVPLGVAAFVALNASPAWPLSPVALVVALVGFVALMPAGTVRARRGPPAALAGLTLFGAGYFGATSLVTLLLTRTFGATLFQAGMVLSAAAITWALASLLAPRFGGQGAPPGFGLALTTACVAGVALLGLAGGDWRVALAVWSVAGLGIGLAYPALYLRATTQVRSLTATELATAAITTESFGGLVGSSAGAALTSVSGAMGIGRAVALPLAYLGFAAFLALASAAALRSSMPTSEGAGP